MKKGIISILIIIVLILTIGVVSCCKKEEPAVFTGDFYSVSDFVGYEFKEDLTYNKYRYFGTDKQVQENGTYIFENNKLTITKLDGKTEKVAFASDKITVRLRDYIKDSKPDFAEYTLSFNTNGGNDISDIKAIAGTSVTLPIPIRTGSTFVSWFDNEFFLSSLEKNFYMPASDLKLFAIWDYSSMQEAYDGIDWQQVSKPNTESLANLVAQNEDIFLKKMYILDNGKTPSIEDVAKYKADLLRCDSLYHKMDSDSTYYDSRFSSYYVWENLDVVCELSPDLDSTTKNELTTTLLERGYFQYGDIFYLNHIFSYLLGNYVIVGDLCVSLDGQYVIGTPISNSKVYNYVFNPTDIIIPDGITKIADFAFYNCSALSSIVLPNSVVNIGSSAFYGCTSLFNISLPDSITDIDPYTFYNCTSLTGLVMPDSIAKIGNCAFYGCKNLSLVVIPSSVTDIGDKAFSNCTHLDSIIIPKGVTNIGTRTFENCTRLSCVIIANSVANIGSDAFVDCNQLTIYAEAKSQPSSWDRNWNSLAEYHNFVPVVWGYDIINQIKYKQFNLPIYKWQNI